jgi:hypothetical protein
VRGRFEQGKSGNPAGRPRGRRPHVSAFDVVFDKTLTVSQNGVERELTVDEALQFKTYQAALKGSKMAVRAVLKMIEKREVALAAQAPRGEQRKSNPFVHVYDSDSADEAMRLLGIASIHEEPSGVGWAHGRLKLESWATQAAISRPGRRCLTQKNMDDVKLLTKNPDKLKWPRGRSQ